MSDCCNDFEFIGQQNSFDMAGWIRGADGVTFYPHVSADGVLSWTNDGGKPNPDSVNIKGADGTPGKSAYAAAQEAGFTGTEAEFAEYLSGIGDLTREVADQKSAIDGKQDAPTAAGLAGQVLGLDEDLNPVWLDQTGGGGGGTTNYNNLTNKPRINGVLLSGDKSAADLGLAAASDIPTIPVQSVNGKTGAVVLDASDVGALPDGTVIPSKTSDLTNDSGFVNAAGAATAAPVQSVNGQTGAVTISVPSASSSGTPAMDGTANRGSSDEYARADHVHPTDTTRAAAAELATYVRPNLLDNWYFVGGGSQLGYGIFPINQRGQTVYTTPSSAGYNIDRWQALSNVTVTINSDNVTPKRNGADTWGLFQTFGGGFEGKTITFSALIKTISGSARLQISYEHEGTIYYLASKDITAAGVTSVTFTALSSYSKLHFVFWLGSTDTTLQIQAAKAELGTTQTLAHQESGVWVLNEVPDYAKQLIACQTSDPFYSTSGLSSTVGTIAAGGVTMFGRFAIVNIRIALTTNITGTTVVLNGLPRPLTASANYVAVTTNYQVTNNYVDGNGNVYINGTLESGAILMIACSYLTN